MFSRVLIDSCVLLDAYFTFRDGHQQARKLLLHLAETDAVCCMPSHAYFEQAVAAIVHFKREPGVLEQNPIDQTTIPDLKLQIVALDNEYANRLLQTLHGAAIPDLKSPDLIYFCIARDQDLTLVTEDRRLRNVARKDGLRAFHVEEALAILQMNA